MRQLSRIMDQSRFESSIRTRGREVDVPSTNTTYRHNIPLAFNKMWQRCLDQGDGSHHAFQVSFDSPRALSGECASSVMKHRQLNKWQDSGGRTRYHKRSSNSPTHQSQKAKIHSRQAHLSSPSSQQYPAPIPPPPPSA